MQLASASRVDASRPPTSAGAISNRTRNGMVLILQTPDWPATRTSSPTRRYIGRDVRSVRVSVTAAAAFLALVTGTSTRGFDELADLLLVVGVLHALRDDEDAAVEVRRGVVRSRLVVVVLEIDLEVVTRDA